MAARSLLRPSTRPSTLPKPAATATSGARSAEWRLTSICGPPLRASRRRGAQQAGDLDAVAKESARSADALQYFGLELAAADDKAPGAAGVGRQSRLSCFAALRAASRRGRASRSRRPSGRASLHHRSCRAGTAPSPAGLRRAPDAPRSRPCPSPRARHPRPRNPPCKLLRPTHSPARCLPHS